MGVREFANMAGCEGAVKSATKFQSKMKAGSGMGGAKAIYSKLGPIGD